MSLPAHTQNSFYGIAPASVRVAALTSALRHGRHQGKPYSWLDLCYERGPKWRIKPTSFTRRNAPGSLRLFHRNSYGPRGWHSQRQSAWGTRGGFLELIAYVTRHEAWEAGEC